MKCLLLLLPISPFLIPSFFLPPDSPEHPSTGCILKFVVLSRASNYLLLSCQQHSLSVSTQYWQRWPLKSFPVIFVSTLLIERIKAIFAFSKRVTGIMEVRSIRLSEDIYTFLNRLQE